MSNAGKNARRELPLILHWSPDRPLPVRRVRAARRRRVETVRDDAPAPFDLGAALRRLCADIAARCPALSHIDPARLILGITQARNARRYGLQARVTPLRCAGGAMERKHGKTLYRVQRYVVAGVEMLYLVTFCVPRFLDAPRDDKLVTVFHELFHISPAFDGDLRRLGGRCTFHSRSQKKYDAHMATLVRDYLATGPDPSLIAWMNLDHAGLVARYGGVVGVVVPRPRLLPVAARTSTAPDLE